MLLTRRLDRLSADPLGFVASEYALAVWGIENLSELFEPQLVDLGQLFEEDMLGDDIDTWLAESNLIKRTFRNCAIISGLVERRHPGQEKMPDSLVFLLTRFTMCCEIINPIWLTENHDLLIPDQLGGTVVNRFESHGVIFRHQPEGG